MGGQYCIGCAGSRPAPAGLPLCRILCQRDVLRLDLVLRIFRVILIASIRAMAAHIVEATVVFVVGVTVIAATSLWLTSFSVKLRVELSKDILGDGQTFTLFKVRGEVNPAGGNKLSRQLTKAQALLTGYRDYARALSHSELASDIHQGRAYLHIFTSKHGKAFCVHESYLRKLGRQTI